MRELGLIDSGDATQQGIGAMRAERIAAFYRQMIDAELYREGDVDVARSYDLQFVNRGAGVAEIAALKSTLPAAAEATTDAPAAR
jgi:NitT/TauT family transport system substrate-binding protein